MATTKPTDPDPRVIDLDAAKAARAEALGEPPVVVWQGETFELPAELPARFLDAIIEDRYTEAFDSLFPSGDFDVAGFLDAGSYQDLRTFAEGIARAYGLEGDLGNLRPSGVSSSHTSKR